MVPLTAKHLFFLFVVSLLGVTFWVALLERNSRHDDTVVGELLGVPSWLGRQTADLDGTLGDMGLPVELPAKLSPAVLVLVRRGWQEQGLNQYVSDMIPLHRRLPDVRDAWCRAEEQARRDRNVGPGTLPSSSIVIVFYNEAWSVLLRTVHSVLDRTPSALIEEILLVDDSSTMEHLQQQLEDYVASLPKVRLIRAPERVGLIRARLLGAKAARSAIITFLDAHCEVIEGWLEALVAHVAQNETMIAIPAIDWIHEDTLALNAQNSVRYYGSFDWGLNFQWRVRSERMPSMAKANSHPAAPYDTPTMAGGLFTIHRSFFERLGWYDEGMQIYGGENMELSFKAWMCGGTMQIVGCSRVAHIQKRGHPYLRQVPDGYGIVRRNSIRVAEVWMDEYADYFYETFGGRAKRGAFGNLTARHELRKRLDCKPYRWYLETVFPEQFDPSKAVARGEIRFADDAKATPLCLDWPSLLSVVACHGYGGHQLWYLTAKGEVTREDHCLDYDGQHLSVVRCHGLGGNQRWTWLPDTRQLKKLTYDRCLQWSGTELLLEVCDSTNPSQRWLFQNYQPNNL
uniref:Polypeptide N-acetylgalactosaminyltransferase n=2 Tax=Anopheles triannulatus TaxID=58253 RepID=A0A2M4AMU6_9DIPT